MIFRFKKKLKNLGFLKWASTALARACFKKFITAHFERLFIPEMT